MQMLKPTDISLTKCQPEGLGMIAVNRFAQRFWLLLAMRRLLSDVEVISTSLEGGFVPRIPVACSAISAISHPTNRHS